MNASTLDMFPRPPRQPPRQMAHFSDVGVREDGEQIAVFECVRCGYDSGWRPSTDTEIRRGVPCPTCAPTANPVAAGIDRTTSGRIGQP